MRKAFPIALVVLALGAVVATALRLSRRAPAVEPKREERVQARAAEPLPPRTPQRVFAYSPIARPKPQPAPREQATPSRAVDAELPTEPLIDFNGERLSALAEEAAELPKLVVLSRRVGPESRAATLELCRSAGALWEDEGATKLDVPGDGLCVTVRGPNEGVAGAGRLRAAAAWVAVRDSPPARHVAIDGRTDDAIARAVRLVAGRLKSPVRDSYSLRARLVAPDCEAPAWCTLGSEPEALTVTAFPGEDAAWRLDVCHDAAGDVSLVTSPVQCGETTLALSAWWVTQEGTTELARGKPVSPFHPVSLWLSLPIPEDAQPGLYSGALKLRVDEHTRTASLVVQVRGAPVRAGRPRGELTCDVTGTLQQDDGRLVRALATLLSKRDRLVFTIDPRATTRSGLPMVRWCRTEGGVDCMVAGLSDPMRACHAAGASVEWVLKLTHGWLDGTPVWDVAGKRVGLLAPADVVRLTESRLLPQLGSTAGGVRVHVTGSRGVFRRWRESGGGEGVWFDAGGNGLGRAPSPTGMRRAWWRAFVQGNGVPTAWALGGRLDLCLLARDGEDRPSWEPTVAYRLWNLGRQDYAFLTAAAKQLGEDRVREVARAAVEGDSPALPSAVRAELAEMLDRRGSGAD